MSIKLSLYSHTPYKYEIMAYKFTIITAGTIWVRVCPDLGLAQPLLLTNSNKALTFKYFVPDQPKFY